MKYREFLWGNTLCNGSPVLSVLKFAGITFHMFHSTWISDSDVLFIHLSFSAVIAQCLLYSRHQKSKDELNKIFDCKNLQCRKMWVCEEILKMWGTRQVQKTLSQEKGQIICWECLEKGDFTFSKRNLEASWRDWHLAGIYSFKELNTCYLAFAMPGIMHSLVNKICVIPAFTKLIKA